MAPHACTARMGEAHRKHGTTAMGRNGTDQLNRGNANIGLRTPASPRGARACATRRCRACSFGSDQALAAFGGVAACAGAAAASAVGGGGIRAHDEAAVPAVVTTVAGLALFSSALLAAAVCVAQARLARQSRAVASLREELAEQQLVHEIERDMLAAEARAKVEEAIDGYAVRESER